jgi:hypothetical protein
LVGDTISVGDITGSNIAIGRGAQVNVIQVFITTLTTGIGHLSSVYASRIKNFLFAYLGKPENPVPFGGREAEMNDLNDWLADPAAPPYLLLAAPAGRGKSALLARWLQQVQASEAAPAVVYFPVSIRFETNLASTAFAALAARLAYLHGEEDVRIDVNMPANAWRGMVSAYLARPLSDGRRLLVVLDGADEAADWQPGPDLFPADPPPGLRVVLAARYRPNETDAEPWLRSLGWERPGLARVLDLDPLTQQGVADVLTRMGVPLDVLGKRVDIVAELHRLSEGDPLLVRLYVDDLLAQGEEATRLQPEDLRGIEPGYIGYFRDYWWKEQKKLWGKDTPLKESAVQALLNLLACARGPLARADVLALAGDCGLNSWAVLAE